MLIAFVVVVAARAVTVYGFGGDRPWLSGAGGLAAWQHVLVWGGLRGTIALALVLSVPAASGRCDARDALTFGVVLLSLLGKG